MYPGLKAYHIYLSWPSSALKADNIYLVCSSRIPKAGKYNLAWLSLDLIDNYIYLATSSPGMNAGNIYIGWLYKPSIA